MENPRSVNGISNDHGMTLTVLGCGLRSPSIPHPIPPQHCPDLTVSQEPLGQVFYLVSFPLYQTPRYLRHPNPNPHLVRALPPPTSLPNTRPALLLALYEKSRPSASKRLYLQITLRLSKMTTFVAYEKRTLFFLAVNRRW